MQNYIMQNYIICFVLANSRTIIGVYLGFISRKSSEITRYPYSVHEPFYRQTPFYYFLNFTFRPTTNIRPGE